MFVAAVASLAKFGASCDELLDSVIVLLDRYDLCTLAVYTVKCCDIGDVLAMVIVYTIVINVLLNKSVYFVLLVKCINRQARKTTLAK